MTQWLRLSTTWLLAAFLWWSTAQLGGSLLWFLSYSSAFLAFCASVYQLLAWTAFRRAVLVARMDDTVYRGEEVKREETMVLSGILPPGVWIGIEETWLHCQTGERLPIRFVARAAGRQVKWTATMQCRLRGEYVRRQIDLRAAGLFGFTLMRLKLNDTAKLWVLPQPWLAAASIQAGPGEGMKRASRHPAWEAIPLVAGTRPYAPGDPLQRIHWRSSARTGIMRSKELERPAGGQQLIVLDAAAEGTDYCGAEAAVEAAAGVAQHSLAAGEAVRLMTVDGGLNQRQAVQGPERLPELLRQLAGVHIVRQGQADAELSGESFSLAGIQAACREGSAAVTIVTARRLPGLSAALGRLTGSVRIVYTGSAAPQAASMQRWLQELEACGVHVMYLSPEEWMDINGQSEPARRGA